MKCGNDHFYTFYIYISFSLRKPREMGIVILILQMIKMRIREIK